MSTGVSTARALEGRRGELSRRADASLFAPTSDPRDRCPPPPPPLHPRPFRPLLTAPAPPATATRPAARGPGPAPAKTAQEALDELSAKIGEKLQLRRAATLEGDKIAVYLHHRSADLPPAVGVLVAYTGDDAEAAKGAAMQVAALKAQFLNEDEVPEETKDKEREIAAATAREEGKPEKIIPNIVEGRLKGYFKDACLLDQPSVTDNKKSVKQVMDAAGVTLTGFVRFEVGQ
jgi:elongation factor Ts